VLKSHAWKKNELREFPLIIFIDPDAPAGVDINVSVQYEIHTQEKFVFQDFLTQIQPMIDRLIETKKLFTVTVQSIVHHTRRNGKLTAQCGNADTENGMLCW